MSLHLAHLNQQLASRIETLEGSFRKMSEVAADRHRRQGNVEFCCTSPSKDINYPPGVVPTETQVISEPETG